MNSYFSIKGLQVSIHQQPCYQPRQRCTTVYGTAPTLQCSDLELRVQVTSPSECRAKPGKVLHFTDAAEFGITVHKKIILLAG